MADKIARVRNASAPNETLTPLMQQYRDIKAGYPDAILFFRLGDFYEMFGNDAIAAAPILDVVLTRRQDLPMCGIPFHAAASYVRKLIMAGRTVAICEQLEEPGVSRGIVKRGVVRLVTPGTIIEDTLLDPRLNNFLAGVCPASDHLSFGIAVLDISTGYFSTTVVSHHQLAAELTRIAPNEIVIPRSLREHTHTARILDPLCRIAEVDDWHFSLDSARARLFERFSVTSLQPLGLGDHPLAAGACGGVLSYLASTRMDAAPAIESPRWYSIDLHLQLFPTVIRHLEILESASGSAVGSLLSAVDESMTPSGARLLRQWLIRPLLDLPEINRRHEIVAWLADDGIRRRAIRSQLRTCIDIERIVGRIGACTVLPRELIGLRETLSSLPVIASDLTGSGTLQVPSEISDQAARLCVPNDPERIISATIALDPPAALKDGGYIKTGHNPDLDDLRAVTTGAKEMISALEKRERERTGISSLKVGYTSVFGYYVEISKTNLPAVPQEYVRKQTVAGGERFITPELKGLEERILSADERIAALELQIYRDTLAELARFTPQMLSCARALAELDVLASFAETACARSFVRPRVDSGRTLEIRAGRHPVVERVLPSGTFVPNDLTLNDADQRIILLTGPNMAGKSTFLRQAAHIVILAQAGSFVPCADARIGLVDRIFTRIGAGDNLAGGESTFMVEMHETAAILNQYTDRSLIILDEIGRGTSTYDGVSIAWSALEYFADPARPQNHGAKILFATHYFELTDLESTLPGLKNYSVAVREWRSDVVFLHSIVPGPADKSYGIHVARLAGLPPAVVARARQIMASLESAAPSGASRRAAAELQPELFASLHDDFFVELDGIDINATTPVEALRILAGLKDRFKSRTH